MHTTVRIIACLAACLAVSLAPVRAADEDDNPEARAEWMKGYEKFEAAQQAEARHNYADAHRQYGEALAVYQQVKARWPQWNPFILDYRIKFCNDKLRTLAGRIRVDQEKLSATEITQLNVVAQQKLATAEGRIVDLESQATRLAQALEKARAEAARGTESTQLAEKLAWENRELQQQVKSLEAKQTELTAQLKELEEERGVLQAYRELQQQLEAVRQKRDEIELASRALAGKMEQLVEENKRLSLERTQAELQVKQQASVTGTIERNLANAQRQLLAVREQLDERDRIVREREQAAAEQTKIIADLKAGLEEVRQKTSETERLKALYAETEKQHAQAREELQAAREKNRLTEAQVERTKKDLDTLQVANTALRQEVARLTAVHQAAEELQRERDDARRQLAASTEQVRKSDERTASQIELNRAMQVDLQRLTKQLEERDKTAAVAVEALQGRTRELTVQVGQLEAELTQARQERDKQDRQLAAAAKAQEELGQQVAGLKREVVERQERLDNMEKAAAPLAEAAAAREKELRAQLDARDRQFAELRVQLAPLREELAALREAAKVVPAAGESVAALTQARQEVAELRRQQTASAKQQQQLTAQVAAQQAELAKLREAAAGQEAMQAEVATLRESAAQLAATRAELAKLREAAAEREAVQAEVSKLREAAAQLAATQAEVARLREAATKPDATQAEVVRLREAAAKLEATQAEVAKLRESAAKLEATQAALWEAKAKLEATQTELAKSRESAAKLEATQAEVAKLRESAAKLEATQTELAKSRESAAKLAETQAELAKSRESAAKLAAAQAEVRETATKLEATQVEMAKLREAATKLEFTQAELREKGTKLEATQAELTKLREAAAGREEAVAELTRTRQQMADTQAAGKDLQGQLEQLQQLVAAQKALIAQKDLRMGKIEQEHTAVRTALDELKQQAETDKQMLTRQLAKALDQYNEQKDVATGAVAARQQAEAELAALRAGKEVAAVEAVSAAEREAHKLLSQALEAEQNGSSEAATWFYQQVLANDKDNLRALTRLGNLAAEAGEYAQAESYLMRAFYQNPDSQDVLVPLGYILVRAERGDLAVAMLSRAVAIYPEDAALHRHLGVACRALGWTDAAEVQLKRAYALDKTDPDTAFNLAILYSTLDQPDMAAARQWYDLAKQLGAELDPGLERVFSKKQE